VSDVRPRNREATRAGFEALTLPWLGDVARFALSLTRDRADADDLVQDTYLKAFRYWHTFIPGNNPRTWLFTICRHTFLRSRRKESAVIESDEGDIDAMPSVIGHVLATRDGLGALFDQIDVRPAIDRAVEALPEPHRSILILVDVEGQSYDEAAGTLGVPVGTVRSRLFRARRAVQGALVAHAKDIGIGRVLNDLQEGDDATGG
jgi:RNA polymerase sigma-70 factor (ECF subfamily)